MIQGKIYWKYKVKRVDVILTSTLSILKYNIIFNI